MISSIKKRGISLCLCFALVFGAMPATVLADDGAETITFNTLGTNYPTYDPATSYPPDMPMFDGVPEHLDAYIETYLDWVGLEGAVLYATGLRDSYVLSVDPENPNTGKRIPGGLAAADNEVGIPSNGMGTDFPTMVSLGQTWNKDLMVAVGDVLGREKMITLLTELSRNRNRHNGTDASGLAGTTSTTISFGVLSDLRINPLNGRFDESYGEDPYLSSILIDYMASGFVGFGDGKASLSGSTTDDTFYTRGIVATKHTSVYNSEWDRQNADNSASARAIYEYQIAAALRGLKTGSVAGGMTSFGRTNGIPNEIHSYNILFNKIAKYGFYSSPDFNGENAMFSGTGMSNGYDLHYVPTRAHALVLMILANVESVRAMGTDQTDVANVFNLVQQGAYGVTEEHVRRAATPLLKQMVRAGLFDEVGADGFPLHYPYVEDSRDGAPEGTVRNASLNYHQQTALQAAQEAVVVLKNGDALPLNTNQTVAVTGFYSDFRDKPTQGRVSTASSENVQYSGETPLLSMARIYQEDGKTASDYISHSNGAQIVAIQADNGMYWTAQPGNGGNLVADFDGEPTLDDTAQLFELFDLGQGFVSLRSLLNGRWVTSPASGSLANTTNTLFDLTEDIDTGAVLGNTSASSLPPRLRLEKNEDGSVSFISNGTTFITAADSMRYVEVAEDGAIQPASAVYNADNAITAARRFQLAELKGVSDDAIGANADVAVVYVGAPARNSAAEFADRSTMSMADNDYKLVEEVAAAQAARGKQTIVVVRSNFPVLMQRIQSNANVSAIVYQPYSGQYDGRALAQALYGQYSPSGRLTSTWYTSDEALPAINEYSIAEGTNRTRSLETIDPRFTVDMTNADPQDTGLTYMYADSANVVYPFGYGLTYSDVGIIYTGMSAPTSADGTFRVDVTLQNVGNRGGYEVVQLYTTKTDSAYGGYVAQKKLTSFEKVYLDAAETRTVTLTVDPDALAIWDVNLGEYIVEDGDYTLQVGSSSSGIERTSTISIGGAAVAGLDPTEDFNVFDHAFASNSVVYKEVSKLRTAESLQEQKIVGEYHAVMSKGEGSWVAIPNVSLGIIEEITARVATNREAGSISVHLDSPDGERIATIAVPVTDPVTVLADGVSFEATELGYEEVEATLADLAEINTSGTHDVYLVFDRANLRIDSMRVGLEVSYTVTFNTGGGTEIEPLEVKEGETITEPEAPELDGFVFRGWYKDAALTELWDFETDVVEADMILYAAWSEYVDKTALLAAIEVAEGLAEGDYTAESLAILAEALAESRQVAEDEDATPAEVAAAVGALIAAIEQLVPGEPTVTNDTKALEALIAANVGRSEALYTPESWASFANALAAAQGTLADPDAIQEAVDAAVAALQQAVDALTAANELPLTEDKSGLESILEEASGLEGEAYTPESWQALQDAIASAQGVLVNENATEADVEAAIAAVRTALLQLDTAGDPGPEPGTVDTAILVEKLAELALLDAKDYTEETWAELAGVIAQAEALLEAEDITQPQVMAMYLRLLQAELGLEEAPEGPEPPDPGRKALQALYDESMAIENDDYTEESWEALQQAIELAEAVLAKENATQYEVQEATEALQAAIDGLATNPTDPDPGPDPGPGPGRPDPQPDPDPQPGPDPDPGTTTPDPDPDPSPSTVTYSILEGTSATYTGSETIRYRLDGQLTDFVGVDMGGVRLIRVADYALESGSVVVTLTESLLSSLQNGSYTITFLFVDGQVSDTLRVERATGGSSGGGSGSSDSAIATTGDAASYGLWIALLAGATAVLAGAIGYKAFKKRKSNS